MDQLSQLVGKRLLQVGGHMRVDVQGDRDMSVAQALGDDLRVSASLKGNRGIGMTNIVKTNPRQGRFGNDPQELLQ